ncbi:MAG TPA: hypothetical protein VMS64_29375 [Candidatus Methylomirabilis sp.]|nr:hypothetical protein [Candidatus Methylomirabilis sp.]
MRPGDFVTIQVKPDTQVAQALKVTVVDTHEPFTLEGIRHF